jgi:hypothetical protein
MPFSLLLVKETVMTGKGDWFQFVTINLEWINPQMKLDAPSYVDDVLGTMQQINSNAVVFCYDEGGYPVYDSELAPKDSHVGPYDVLRLLRDGTRRRGQRLFVGVLGQPNLYVSRAHPGWRVRDQNGVSREWVVIDSCPNSPYGDYIARLVGEVAAKYEPDGFYVEGFAQFAGMGCHCSYCQEKFRREYGREIPKGSYAELAADREFNEFRYNAVADVTRRIRQAIDQVNPKIVLVGTGYFPERVDLRKLAPYVDAVSMEQQWGYAGWPEASKPLHELGLTVQVMRAESHKPMFSTMWISRNVDWDYSPRSDNHIRLTFMNMLQYGGVPQLHIQNAYQTERATQPVVTELYTAELRMRPYLLNAEIVGQAALLDWADPCNVVVGQGPRGGAKPGTYFDDSFRGYYRALLEHHIPVRVIIPEDIEAGELTKFPVLVLANAERLSDAVQEKIRAYVEGGGSLVLTYRSGFRDERGGRRARPGLAGLAGVKDLFGEVINPSGPNTPPWDANFQSGGVVLPHTYFRLLNDEPQWPELKGRLLSFKGPYVEMEAEPDALQIAQVVDFDYARMHPEHTVTGWYPWEPIRPLIVGRQVGKGRAVYIAAELDGASFRFGDPESLAILAGAVRWAGQGQSLLETNVPETVEIAVQRTPDGQKQCVILTNQSTNQRYPDPIRTVVPIHDVVVRLRMGGKTVTGVRTATGRGVEWSQANGWLTVQLPLLQAYEAFLVDLA